MIGLYLILPSLSLLHVFICNIFCIHDGIYQFLKEKAILYILNCNLRRGGKECVFSCTTFSFLIKSFVKVSPSLSSTFSKRIRALFCKDVREMQAHKNRFKVM